MKDFFSKLNPAWIFLGFLLILSIHYEYPEIAFKRPQSIHHWRQADCASLALMYYQNGMKFFEPQTHNLTSDGGTTGFVAPNELPILYYFVAILYKIFGYHDYIFRILNTLIFLTGMFYLFKVFQLVSKSNFWSISAALLFFTSPVLVYYGNNFLSNSAALAFSIIGWYYYLRYRELKVPKLFYWSIFFFCLGCCMKISAGFSLFALITAYGLEKIKIIRFGKEPIFPKGLWPVAAFIVAIAIPFGWILFAHHYNTVHGSGYFSTGTYPYWSLNADSIFRVKDNVWNLWRYQYFSNAALILLGILLLLQLVLFFKNVKLFVVILFTMLIEAIIYILLQFNTFADHDYYTIDLNIVLIFIVVSTLALLKKQIPQGLNNVYIKLIFVIFLAYNVYYAKSQMKLRYYGWMNEYPAYKDFHTIEPYLRSLGIAPLDTIVTIPEYSHFIHYLTNQRGWTKFTGENSPRTSSEQITADSLFMETNIAHGAKYLLVLDTQKTFKLMPAFRNYNFNLMGKYGNVAIYALKH